MKLSKVLLGAILVGITVPAMTSCKKQCKDDTVKPLSENPKEHPLPVVNPEPCPACGMG